MNFETLTKLVKPIRKSCNDFTGKIGPLVQDSRAVTPGCAFIAIKGTETDGHLFLDAAVEKGARILICETPYQTTVSGVCVLETKNTRALAGPLAQEFQGNPAAGLKIVGITGTNGKTTTATLVYQILCALDKKASLLGTVTKIISGKEFGSKLTTSGPIELAADMRAMVDSGSEYLVMEVSSHALEQQRVNGINFDVAVFTNLSHDHLDYHHTMDEYAKAKKILFDHMNTTSTAIVNADDTYGDFMIKDCRAIHHRLHFGDADSRIVSNTTNGLVIELNGRRIESPLIGIFNAYNVAEAFMVCKALQLPEHEITAALKKATGAPGRMESVGIESEIPLPKVIVDYSHTPGALDNALSTLYELKNPEQKLVVVFGAGGDRDRMKRPEMAEVSERLSDLVIVTSDNPRTEKPEAIIAEIMTGFKNAGSVRQFVSRKEAIYKAIELATANDIILIAGKGHETYQEINGIRHPFDDRVVAREALRLKIKGAF